MKSKITLLLFFILQVKLNLATGGIIRSVIKEEKLLKTKPPKNIAKESKSFLHEIQINGKVLETHQNKLAKWWERNEERINTGIDIVDCVNNTASSSTEENEINQCLKEIYHNPKFSLFYIETCKKFKQDSISNQGILTLLLGRKWCNFNIDSMQLYKIFFSLSNTFAKQELQQELILSNCDPALLERIKTIAKERNIDLDYQTCSNLSNNSNNNYKVWYIILIIIILVIVINYIKRKISHSFENTSKKRFFKGKAVKKPSKTETAE